MYLSRSKYFSISGGNCGHFFNRPSGSDVQTPHFTQPILKPSATRVCLHISSFSHLCAGWLSPTLRTTCSTCMHISLINFLRWFDGWPGLDGLRVEFFAAAKAVETLLTLGGTEVVERLRTATRVSTISRKPSSVHWFVFLSESTRKRGPEAPKRPEHIKQHVEEKQQIPDSLGTRQLTELCDTCSTQILHPQWFQHHHNQWIVRVCRASGVAKSRKQFLPW